MVPDGGFVQWCCVKERQASRFRIMVILFNGVCEAGMP